MNFQDKKIAGWRFFIFFLFLFCSLNQPIHAVFLGTPKTGLQNLGSEQYPYSIYVPQEYVSDRSWPLVIVLYVAGGGKDKELIEHWAREAQRRGFVLLCPGFNIFMQGNPSASDRRILKLINEVRTQYEIDSKRVLITGFGDAGHYALYLGMRFPQEINFVAAIGNALSGPLQKLFRFAYARDNRVPILILTGNQNPADDSRFQKELETFKNRGYQVDVVPAETISSAADPSAIPFVIDWFDEIGKKYRQGRTDDSSGLKQKLFKWLDQTLTHS